MIVEDKTIIHFCPRRKSIIYERDNKYKSIHLKMSRLECLEMLLGSKALVLIQKTKSMSSNAVSYLIKYAREASKYSFEVRVIVLQAS